MRLAAPSECGLLLTIDDTWMVSGVTAGLVTGKSVREFIANPGYPYPPVTVRAGRRPTTQADLRGDLTMTDVEKVGKKRGPVAGTEEARRGGEAVRKKYGREFYSRIGKKGGDTVRREHGSEFYAEIGRKGGEQTKNRQGSEFYARIGRIGGQRNRARVQPDTHKK